MSCHGRFPRSIFILVCSILSVFNTTYYPCNPMGYIYSSIGMPENNPVHVEYRARLVNMRVLNVTRDGRLCRFGWMARKGRTERTRRTARKVGFLDVLEDSEDGHPPSTLTSSLRNTADRIRKIEGN